MACRCERAYLGATVFAVPPSDCCPAVLAFWGRSDKEGPPVRRLEMGIRKSKPGAGLAGVRRVESATGRAHDKGKEGREKDGRWRPSYPDLAFLSERDRGLCLRSRAASVGGPRDPKKKFCGGSGSRLKPVDGPFFRDLRRPGPDAAFAGLGRLDRGQGTAGAGQSRARAEFRLRRERRGGWMCAFTKQSAR
jgi:hypothetical protein